MATSTAELVLLELSTGALTSWPLGAPVDTLLGVPAEDPRQVLAFARGQSRDRLQVIDLEGLLAGRRGAVATRSLGHPLREVVLAPSGRQAVLLHDEQRTALSNSTWSANPSPIRRSSSAMRSARSRSWARRISWPPCGAAAPRHPRP
ncbi:MAG: hypothetical protein IPG96_08110 [Proteobacteria bacterium]|nr:hypothetical protein [Pseudomonadota bacterium]